jgi:hypothetical protein
MGFLERLNRFPPSAVIEAGKRGANKGAGIDLRRNAGCEKLHYPDGGIPGHVVR